MTDTPATTAAPAPAAPVNTVLADSAKTAAQAAETAADAVASKETAKVESWEHKQWAALKAKIVAAVEEAEAFVKAHL